MLFSFDGERNRELVVGVENSAKYLVELGVQAPYI